MTGRAPLFNQQALVVEGPEWFPSQLLGSTPQKVGTLLGSYNLRMRRNVPLGMKEERGGEGRPGFEGQWSDLGD